MCFLKYVFWIIFNPITAMVCSYKMFHVFRMIMNGFWVSNSCAIRATFPVKTVIPTNQLAVYVYGLIECLCQALLTQIWFGELSVENPHWKILLCMIFFPLIYTGFLIFR